MVQGRRLVNPVSSTPSFPIRSILRCYLDLDNVTFNIGVSEAVEVRSSRLFAKCSVTLVTSSQVQGAQDLLLESHRATFICS